MTQGGRSPLELSWTQRWFTVSQLLLVHAFQSRSFLDNWLLASHMTNFSASMDLERKQVQDALAYAADLVASESVYAVAGE